MKNKENNTSPPLVGTLVVVTESDFPGATVSLWHSYPGGLRSVIFYTGEDALPPRTSLYPGDAGVVIEGPPHPNSPLVKTVFPDRGGISGWVRFRELKWS